MMVKRAAACAESDDATTTVTLLQPLLDSDGLDPGVRSAVEDNLAWAYLLLDDAALIERALPLLANARAVQPWQTSFAVAEACVLGPVRSGGGRRGHRNPVSRCRKVPGRDRCASTSPRTKIPKSLKKFRKPHSFRVRM
jgi:hypothetical protein